jgi:hypothetical protein
MCRAYGRRNLEQLRSRLIEFAQPPRLGQGEELQGGIRRAGALFALRRVEGAAGATLGLGG